MIGLASVLMWIAIGASLGAALWPRGGHWLLPVAAAALVVAATALGRALWRLDLSLVYVADHARAGASGPYRLAGLWGGPSGSLLLFTSMVAVTVAASGSARHRATPLSFAAGRWGGATVAMFTLATVTLANPFERLAIPAIAGGGLQPILEHPAMLYHPPLLYAGLVSTIVPALMVLAAGSGRVARPGLRRALAASVALLTVSQLAGANWAYVELGWGGYWGWDPVENTVLVVWLLAIAAMHAARHPGNDRIVAALSLAPWIAVLIGATITRSGTGGGVHAFADDERLGWALVAIVLAFAAVAVLATAHQQTRRRMQQPLLLLSAALATVAAVVVMAGVLYPIPAPGEPLVQGRYFALATAPLAIVALVGAVRAVSLRARRGALIGGAMAGLVIGGLLGARTPFALAVAAGVGLLAVSVVERAHHRAGTMRWPGLIAHLGFAALMIGIAGSTQADRATVGLEPGETVEVAGTTFRHIGATVIDGPVPEARAVQATLERLATPLPGSEVTATFTPAVVAYADRGVLLAEVALESRPMRDTQIVLRTATDNGGAVYDISVTPLVVWVWWGAGAMAVGAAGAALTAAVTGRRTSATDTPAAPASITAP